MDTDYKEEYLEFTDFLKENNYELKEISDSDKEICKRLSTIMIDSINPNSFSYNKRNQVFLQSIKNLGKYTKDYYKKNIKLIKKEKIDEFDNGYAEIAGNSKKQKIFITNKPFTDMDFIAYSHELGHIPALKDGTHGEYFEYSEVLSIFLEYLSCIPIYKENAKNIFLKNRLLIAKDEATNYLNMDNEVCYVDKYHYLYLESMKRDCIKYIYSLEYVLYLIELYDNDLNKIKNVIDSIIYDSSFKEKEIELGLIINNYNKLMKEI